MDESKAARMVEALESIARTLIKIEAHMEMVDEYVQGLMPEEPYEEPREIYREPVDYERYR